MGLPEKITNTLTGSKIPATRDQTTGKSPSKLARTRSRDPASKKLPSFKPPELPAGYRALLVACANTGRASWAVLKSETATGAGRSSWRFTRNIPAVPDDGGASSTFTKAPRSQESLADPELSIKHVDLTHFACEMCGAAEPDAVLIRCGACATLQCKPAKSWRCPGCGARLGETNMAEIDSLRAERGSAPPDSATGLPASGAGGKKSIEESQAIPASGRTGRGKDR